MKRLFLLLSILILLPAQVNAVNWEAIPNVRPMDYFDTDSAKIIDGSLLIAIRFYSGYGDTIISYIKINPEKNMWYLLFYKEYDKNEYDSSEILKYDSSKLKGQAIEAHSVVLYIRNKYFDKSTYKYNEEAYKKDVAKNAAAHKQYKYYTHKVWSTIYRNWKPSKNTNDRSIVDMILRINKEGSVVSYIIRKPVSQEMKNSLIEAIKKSKFEPLPQYLEMEFIDIPLRFNVI